MTEPQQVYIAVYHHEDGQSHAVFSFKPTDAQLAEFWKDEYEPERENEYFEVVGPFEVLDQIKSGGDVIERLPERIQKCAYDFAGHFFGVGLLSR